MKNKILINLERDGLFDDLGLTRLRESYMREEESSPQERFAYVCEEFGSNPEHAQRLYEYTSNGGPYPRLASVTGEANGECPLVASCLTLMIAPKD